MKTIIVRWVKCGGMYSFEMRVIESNHPQFVKGERFDFGFFTVATNEGYTIISLPLDER